MKNQFNIGVVGLGVMGRNLALNIERNGYHVIGFDRDAEKLAEVSRKYSGRNLTTATNIDQFLMQLESPKRILIMVPAGSPVDAVIGELLPKLQQGDLLIDGGNSHFQDTERRWQALREKGILYIGTGISGGEEGALRGPSIMPGGDPEAWPLVQPVLQAIAAKTAVGEPCCRWVGAGGAGHFVKMVHNGIEYADMQMICEAYMLMQQGLGMTAGEMSDVFAAWNAGELQSYLVEITAKILQKKDDKTGRPLVDVILDTAGQKGTGKWTSQAALDLGIPAQTIAEAVFARTMSALKDERVAAAAKLPAPVDGFSGNKQAFVKQLRGALFASKICSYAQGFQLMAAADAEYGWHLDFGDIALLWQSGCIIRANFLQEIKRAYDNQPDLPNLLLDAYFATEIEQSQTAWRRVIAEAVMLGIPVPALSSALAYYDSYRSERLPANLLQAQRDFFGAHTYERTDAERGQFFHTEWR